MPFAPVEAFKSQETRGGGGGGCLLDLVLAPLCIPILPVHDLVLYKQGTTLFCFGALLWRAPLSSSSGTPPLTVRWLFFLTFRTKILLWYNMVFILLVGEEKHPVSRSALSLFEVQTIRRHSVLPILETVTATAVCAFLMA